MIIHRNDLKRDLYLHGFPKRYVNEVDEKINNKQEFDDKYINVKIYDINAKFIDIEYK